MEAMEAPKKRAQFFNLFKEVKLEAFICKGKIKEGTTSNSGDLINRSRCQFHLPSPPKMAVWLPFSPPPLLAAGLAEGPQRLRVATAACGNRALLEEGEFFVGTRGGGCFN